MRDAAVVSVLVSCPAFDAESTVSHGRTASLYCILQTASCLSASHPLPPASFDPVNIVKQESRSSFLSDTVLLEIIQFVVLGVYEHFIAV